MLYGKSILIFNLMYFELSGQNIENHTTEATDFILGVLLNKGIIVYDVVLNMQTYQVSMLFLCFRFVNGLNRIVNVTTAAAEIGEILLYSNYTLIKSGR